MEWDIFISHASEDKSSVARPLARLLTDRGLRVWFDESSLTIGDSLRRSIDRGLLHSRFGLVILSPSFFQKEWPQKELDGLVSRESNGTKVLLPIWHDVKHEDVLRYSALLADRVAISTKGGLESVVRNVLEATGGPTTKLQSHDQVKRKGATERIPAQQSQKRYKALFRWTPKQIPADCLAFAPRRKGWGGPLADLAQLAKPEDWSFKRAEKLDSTNGYPILRRYLEQTFLRLQDQGRISFNMDDGICCFNTGLQTTDERDLYALFSRSSTSRTDQLCDWLYSGFVDSASRRLRSVQPLPAMASYHCQPGDLIYHVDYDLVVNIDHLLDKTILNRLPEEIRNSRRLAIYAIEGAMNQLKGKILRHPRIAIPTWYPRLQRIQLLLPLCISYSDRADVALVAERDDSAKVYHVRTFLPLDMAYTHARLITRPDQGWLME